MKTTEIKNRYVELRANGVSQVKAAKELGVARQTCYKWEKGLDERIRQKKRDDLEELYAKYGMVKAARIKQLGETLNQINDALKETDWSAVPPDRLLKLKLDYIEKLRGEFAAVTAKPVTNREDMEASDLLACAVDLLERIKNSDVTPEQAAAEQRALSALIASYEAVQTKGRIEEIEAIIDDLKAKGKTE